MAFVANDKTRVLKYQAYEVRSDAYTSATLSQMIDEQMASIEADLPDLVAVIQADLDTLDTLDASLTTEQGSTNAGLVRADVLEWDVSRKTSGISSEFERIRRRIAQMLSQQIGRSPSGMGSLMRG